MLKKGIHAIIVLAFVSVFAAAAGAVTEYEFDFRNYPNPFFPGHEVAGFYYDLPSGGTISIYVYDLESRLVRTVVENYPQGNGEHAGELEWDGWDDRGELVPPGPYVVVLEVNIAREIYRDTFVAVVNR